MNNSLLSSVRHDWETPPEIFLPLCDEFGLDLDVCANECNRKLPLYFSIEDDGLNKPWAPFHCWMNPPYGRQISKWIRKAYEESTRGALVVCLVPARTDTYWWHDYVVKGEIRFLKGRIKFVGAKHPAPFPSAVVIFWPRTK